MREFQVSGSLCPVWHRYGSNWSKTVHSIKDKFINICFILVLVFGIGIYLFRYFSSSDLSVSLLSSFLKEPRQVASQNSKV